MAAGGGTLVGPWWDLLAEVPPQKGERFQGVGAHWWDWWDLLSTLVHARTRAPARTHGGNGPTAPTGPTGEGGLVVSGEVGATPQATRPGTAAP